MSFRGLGTVLACLVIVGQVGSSAGSLPHRANGDETKAPAKVTFTKQLKGSVPECVTISVTADGSAMYDGRKCDDPPSLRPFKLSAATTQKIFDLAAEMRNFNSIDLESHRKVANLGLKTFTYENGPERNQVQFNYTLRPEAQELVDLCEKISSVQQHVVALEYLMRYDHLGLPKELQQIQIDLENKALADPEVMSPTLERIARNPKLLHLAQSRAEDILQRLHSSDN